DRLSLVVRGADTDRHDLSAQSAGLLAISVGLSRQYRDDLAQLEAGMAVYDALYRWARDGFDEGHDWPAARRT
ncbi:MAG: chromate resistance protein ChrB domain-containing protein, partial [Paracoccaceae bacterium]